MQITTLIDVIADRHEVAPLIKLTVSDHANSSDHELPPKLDLSYEELGSKLVNFARSRNVTLEFRVVSSSYTNGLPVLIEHLRVQRLVYSGEALVINCDMMLHYIPDETLITSLRSLFHKALRGLDPTLVVLVDEDVDLTSSNLVSRLRSAFNYLWIPYDTEETFLPRGSKQRQWYEADICWKIENVIDPEGVQRVERVERVQRMRNANFQGVGFGEECVVEVKPMLDGTCCWMGIEERR
ncbi:LOW QUALITY PROTEIN: putative scarecrow-like protein 16 [Lathyrus oleraceus]|uniref:LOW QUALITY PROTEIN: putative scarecrow-like protein 16 n=1 Tax=Pisum sativum TaxID=3888 RepID=UPI0021D1A586|nr:LOW QUALITY PROTEIN: putative scarecrow-like protein 16 [Pisum sativum]